MNRVEWEVEIAELVALARTQRREAIAAGEPLRAMRAQLVLMAADGLLADEIGWANAVLDVSEILADIE